MRESRQKVPLMFIPFRVPLRSVALGFVLCIVVASASGQSILDDLIVSDTITEGAGDNTSYLVVTFGATTGNAYAFAYHWDTPTDAFGMIDALSSGVSELTIGVIDYGTVSQPNYFIDNIAYAAELGDAGQYWSQWEGFHDAALDDVAWVGGQGISNVQLADGLFVGLSNPFSLDPADAPVLPTPEPGTAAVLLASLAMLCRRRGSGMPA